MGFLGSTSGKIAACQCGRCKSLRFDPWVKKILWSRKWQPAPVFLPGKFHGQRSLVGCSPQGCKESDTTERRVSVSSVYAYTGWAWCYCLVAKLCLTLCNSMDCSPPGSSVHGISQARILEQIAISYSGGSPQPRARTHISCISRWILYHCATWKAHISTVWFSK